MSAHLIEQLAKQEGLDALPKVDPNTQSISPREAENVNLLAQAAITSVLAAFYKYSRNEENAQSILKENISESWPDHLFGDSKDELIRKIASYAGVSGTKASAKINAVISNFLRIIKDYAAEHKNKSIKALLTEERNTILSHLPAAIGLGKMLDDTTLDDRTNKMDGPVSGLMHTIEKTFAGSDNPEEKK